MADRSNPTKKLYVKTWGCQMNEHDSQVVQGILRDQGYEATDNPNDADMIFLNTCSVREKAENKLYSHLGTLRELKEAKPELKIAVGGCVAQQERTNITSRAPHVDLVVGTHQFRKIGEMVKEIEPEPAATGSVQTRWIMGDSEARFDEPFYPVDKSARSAMVTVMEGCDQVCSFCIVPFTRGREISRPAADVVQKVQRFADEGVVEVLLLGQNVNAYGKKEDGFPSFAELLRQVCAVPGIRRVRFTSPHPQDFDRSLAEAYRDEPNLCPVAHIPLQAGNDDVLAAMKRSYNAATYIETVKMLREHRPDIALSTDIIVGFPGETRTQFEDTLKLMREIRFDQVFSFVYSARPFTPARKLPDPVPLAEKKAWLQELQQLQDDLQAERHKSLAGEDYEILVANWDRDSQRASGRTVHNRIVHFDWPAETDPSGTFVNVRIVEGLRHSLRGELISYT